MTAKSGRGAQLAQNLLDSSGPLLTRAELWRALGFSNSASFRQAKVRGQLGVRVFTVPERRGTFAYTADVADWLRNLDEEASM